MNQKGNYFVVTKSKLSFRKVFKHVKNNEDENNAQSVGEDLDG